MSKSFKYTSYIDNIIEFFLENCSSKNAISSCLKFIINFLKFSVYSLYEFWIFNSFEFLFFLKLLIKIFLILSSIIFMLELLFLYSDIIIFISSFF